jgi:hypothetical protein
VVAVLGEELFGCQEDRMAAVGPRAFGGCGRACGALR